MADMNDLEGGGGGSAPTYSGNTPPTSGSGSSYGLNNRDSVSYAPPPVYDSGKSPASKRRVINRHGYQSLLLNAGDVMSNDMLKKSIGVLVAVIIVGAFVLPTNMKVLWLVYGAVVFGAVVSMWLSKNVLSCDDGTPEMRAVSDPIKEGAEGFLHVQYTVSSRSSGICMSHAQSLFSTNLTLYNLRSTIKYLGNCEICNPFIITNNLFISISTTN